MNGKRGNALGRLPAGRQNRAKNNLTAAQQRNKGSRLPKGHIGRPGLARKGPPKGRPGGGKVTGLNSKQRRLAGGLPGALGKKIHGFKPLNQANINGALALLGRGTLSPAQIAILRWAIRHNIPNAGIFGFDTALTGIYDGAGTALPGDDDDGDPTLTLPGGGTIPVPPGFNPSFPVVWYPNSPGDGGGKGCCLGVDPDSISGYTFSGCDDVDDATDEDTLEAAASSIWQTTRFLRVSNATGQKLKVYLKYEANTEEGDWIWAPSEEEEPLVFELEPGEVADLADGDWQINASRVFIWAEGDGKEWNRFKDSELWLVPETDEEGNHGYADPEVETFQFAFE